MRVTITRPRDESAEDKKARKSAAKAERQARRVEKRATKEQFAAEVKGQKKAMASREGARVRKL
jgi:protein LTV1